MFLSANMLSISCLHSHNGFDKCLICFASKSQCFDCLPNEAGRLDVVTHCFPRSADSRLQNEDDKSSCGLKVLFFAPEDLEELLWYLRQVCFWKNTTNGVESMEEVRAAIKDIIEYRSLSGKFSSVHSDLAAEGITRWGRKDPFFSEKRFRFSKRCPASKWLGPVTTASTSSPLGIGSASELSVWFAWPA